MAEIKPDIIFKILQDEVDYFKIHDQYPGFILEILRSIIKKHAQKLQIYLHIIIEIILKCLDPNIPSLRTNCQKKCTYALYTVVKNFPMVSFHQNSQRLAIGTKENLIVIYDLRTAAKWRILEGHEGAISSICFDIAGKFIASYSNMDLTVRIWKVGSTGFFGSILGMSAKHQKKFTVEKDYRNGIFSNNYASKIEWTANNKKIVLHRESK